MVRRMRLMLLACCLVLATPALAQKPPPLGVPWNGPGAPAPPAGFTGKPPPIGSTTPSPGRGEPAFAEPGRPGLPDPRERAASSGTGFIVAEGRVLTNRHVIEDCGRVVARNANAARLPARVLASDANRDLALLAVAPSMGPPLTFRDAPRSAAARTSSPTASLSGLLSSGPSLTTGNISALAGMRDNPGNFQISAAVQPGNCGGPLFDSRGNVVGVVVSKLNAARVAQMTGGDIPQNVNFAVKGTEASPSCANKASSPAPPRAAARRSARTRWTRSPTRPPSISSASADADWRVAGAPCRRRRATLSRARRRPPRCARAGTAGAWRLLRWGLIACIWAASPAAVTLVWFARDLPRPETGRSMQPAGPA